MNAATLRKAISASYLIFLFLNAAIPGVAAPDGEARMMMDKITFRVDMSGVGVNPSGVYLAASFFSTIGLPNWTPLPMCDIGGGLWEISFCNVPPGAYQYKFLNGPGGWEFDGFGAPCTNPADNQNRFITVTGGMQLAGPFGFNSCSTTGNTGGADVTPPVITGPVPANTTVTCGDPLPAGAPLAADDGCDVNCTQFTGAPADNNSGLNACGLGAVVRTWTATDGAGNTATATQTITLIDNTPPSISGVPGPITVGCDALPPGAPLPASDACDAAVASTGPPADDASGLNACGVGVLLRTWTAADCSGNTTTATQSITLQDNAPPVITGAPPANITVGCGAIPPPSPLPATDDCDAAVTTTGLPVDDASGLNACGVGVIIRTWTVADCSGNTTAVTQAITVQDVAPPVINGPAPGGITVGCGAIPAGAPLAASDGCDAGVVSTGPPVDDLSGLGPCGTGVVLRTWTVSDCSGNTATTAQTINVADNQPPAISNPPANVSLSCGSPLPPAQPLSASDNCDPNVTTTGLPVDDASGLNACGLGAIIRTWTATDCSGNDATVSQTITLTDAVPPVITQAVPPDIVVDCSGAVPPAAPLSAFDDCDPNVVLTDMPQDGLSGLDACGTGSILRSWTVTDCSGNTAVATQTITIVDLEAPSILDPIPPDVQVSCNDMPPPAPLAAFDLCDGTVFSTGMPSDDFSGLGACGTGEVVRTWAVTDCSGNTTTASQVITLIDAAPPTIDGPVPADVTVNCNNLPPPMPLAAFDDCDGNVVSTGMPADGLSGLNACGAGEMIRTWTVTDCSGNTTTATQVITITDDSPPVLMIPPDGTFDCNSIPPASAADATASDDCSTPTLVYEGETIVGSGCPYQIHRTWSAMDACGNSVSLTQVITVQDTTPPVLADPPEDITVCEGELPPMEALTWTDNCDGTGSVMGTETSGGMSDPETITRTWAYIDGCGNQAEYTQTITIVAAPSADAGERLVLCEGERANLSATISGGIDSTFWASTGDGAFDDPSNPDAVYTPGSNDLSSGQAMLVFSALPAAAGCPSATDTIVLAFTPLPPADAGPDQEITCDEPMVMIGNNTGDSLLYVWSGPGIDSANRNSPTPEVGISGLYILAVSTAGSTCVVSDTVMVFTDNSLPVAEAGNSRTINCRQDAVRLDGTGSSAGPGFTFSWAGPGIDTSNRSELNPLVSLPGAYTIGVVNTANGCTATDVVEVFLDILSPEADAGPMPTIDCNTPMAMMDGSGSSAGSGIIYQWLAPGGSPLGTASQQAATEGGVYTLLVTDTTNGCSASDAVEVLVDTLSPIAEIGPGRALTCTNPGLILTNAPGNAGAPLGYTWAREGATVSNDSTLAVSTPGRYRLAVTNTLNGCTAADEVEITENTTRPVADAGPGGLLTCTDNCLALGGPGTSAGPTFTYQWTGAAGAVPEASTAAPETCAPDTYTLLVTDTINGCTAVDTAIVTEDASLPAVSARASDTLDCVVSEITLSGAGSSTGAEFGYEWRGGNGQLISTGLEATVAQPGQYTFTVINSQTQCRSTVTLNVPLDTLPPAAGAGADLALDCATPVVELAGGQEPVAGIQYEWRDENGNLLGTAPSQAVSEPGTYVLAATSESNGCQTVDATTVVNNIVYPAADAGPPGILDCTNTSVTLDGGSSSAGPNFTYSWTGPGFTSDLISPQAGVPGSYILAVTDTSNSCTAMDTVMISIDTIPPAADAGPDVILSCSGPEAQLDGSGSAQGSSLSYTWIDAGGSALGAGQLLLVDSPGVYRLHITDTRNGCTAADEVAVSIDTVPPVARAAAAEALTCLQLSAALDGAGSEEGDNIMYQWSGPGLAGDGTLLLEEATEPGLYTLTVLNTENGCTASATVEVRQNTDQPTAFAGPGGALTCREPSVMLQGSSSSSEASFLWSGPGIDTANENLPGPTVRLPGLYSLVVTDVGNGCTSEPAAVNVTDNRGLPSAEAVATDSLDCLASAVLLDGSNSARGDTITYQWYYGGQAIGGATTAGWMADAAGEYVLEVRNINTECINTDTVLVVENRELPPVQIEGETTLNCYQPALQLQETASAGLAGYSLEWSTAGGNIVSVSSGGAVAEVDAGGWYVVTVRNLLNGCERPDSIRVEEDLEQPAVVLEDRYRLDCREEQVEIEPVFSTSPGQLSIEWSGPGFSADSPSIVVAEPGGYTLDALLLRTGCAVSLLTEVLPGEGIRKLDVGVAPPACFGDADGFLQISAVDGGSPPYLFALDGGPFAAGQEWGPLPPGNYRLAAQDSEGCEIEREITIPEGEVFEINLGEDIEITAGDSLRLSVHAGPAAAVYSWQGPADSYLSCRDCPAPVARPLTTSVFSLLATSVNGCRSEDAITVFVARRDLVYTPNVFSPNGDGQNDYFTVYPARAGAQVRKLQVFGRWGTLLFQAENIPGGVPELGWGGLARGNEAAPGVYVFHAEVVMPDGRVEIISGEVMLMR
ncbi:MAG: gliding motility-associated C-terminal domain-containing protein [Phaeodactylibacter sp.]|nr:gliding motility-associated C-terminal domain-containing protein [Phaeodactylibacter sp.]